MSEHRILRLKPALRLERRGQHGQNKTEQPDHSASLGDSIRSSTQIRFSVHTHNPRSLANGDRVERCAPISSSLTPRPNPHSVRCTAAAHLLRFRALALLGRRPPQRVDGLVMPASEKPAQQRTFDASTTTPEKHLAFVHSQKASRWRSSRCGSSNCTFLNSSRSKAWCGNNRLPGRQSRLDKGDP